MVNPSIEVNFGANGFLNIFRAYGLHFMLFGDKETFTMAHVSPNHFAKIDAELKFAYRKHTDSRLLEWESVREEENLAPYNHTLQFKYGKNNGVTLIVTTEHMDRKTTVTIPLTEEDIKKIHTALVSNLAE